MPANFVLWMEIYVILLKFIRFLATVRGSLAEAPELVGKRTIGQLFVDDPPFTWEVNGTIYCSYKLLPGRIQRYCLSVRSSDGSITFIEMKCRGAGQTKGPTRFY